MASFFRRNWRRDPRDLVNWLFPYSCISFVLGVFISLMALVHSPFDDRYEQISLGLTASEMHTMVNALLADMDNYGLSEASQPKVRASYHLLYSLRDNMAQVASFSVGSADHSIGVTKLREDMRLHPFPGTGSYYLENSHWLSICTILVAPFFTLVVPFIVFERLKKKREREWYRENSRRWGAA